MTTFNNTFEIELTQEDEGYESGSESLNIPTPLRRAPRIYHVSMMEGLSFDHTTPLTTAEQQPANSPQRFRCHSPVCCCLVFSHSDEESPERPGSLHLQYSSTPDGSPVHRRAELPSPVQHHTFTKPQNSLSKMTLQKKLFLQLHWMMMFGWKIQ